MTQVPVPIEVDPALRATAETLFALEPQSALYVPRPATTRALQWLVSEIEANTPLILLSGPRGIGKSLILQRVAATAAIDQVRSVRGIAHPTSPRYGRSSHTYGVASRYGTEQPRAPLGEKLT